MTYLSQSIQGIGYFIFKFVITIIINNIIELRCFVFLYF